MNIGASRTQRHGSKNGSTEMSPRREKYNYLTARQPKQNTNGPEL